MKKSLLMLVSLVIVMVSFTGCFNHSNGNQISIGVIQLVEHQSLKLLYDGLYDELNTLGYIDGENIYINYNNAQGSQANLVNIADKLVNERSDLIVAIATNAAQVVANKTKNIPIVITSITDPVDAKLVETIEKPNTNVTGTSDLISIKEQVSIIKDTAPNVKKVGILYSSSESNSLFQAIKVKEELKKLGIEGIDYTVSNINDIQLVTQSMLGKVDAVYIPNDNTVVTAISTVIDVFNTAKIPVYTSDIDSVEKGALASYGVDYYELGKQTAHMVKDILKDNKNPKDMAIQYPKVVNLVINRKTADMLDINIPSKLEQKAKFVG